MKCFTQYTRGNPNTINGEQLIVTVIYSSFNKEEIDALEKKLSETIAFGVSTDVTMDYEPDDWDSLSNAERDHQRRELMSELISRESLKQRINLNYNSHQYIDAQSVKDIIDTEPTVEDKTVEELEKIREDIENIRDWVGGTRRYFSEDELNEIFDKHISKLKGETE